MTANYEKTSGPLSSVEDVYLVRVFIVSERDSVCVRESNREPALLPFLPSGEGREEENWEESPRSTDAVQRLRVARACAAGLLPEQANANHPNRE